MSGFIWLSAGINGDCCENHSKYLGSIFHQISSRSIQLFGSWLILQLWNEVSISVVVQDETV